MPAPVAADDRTGVCRGHARRIKLDGEALTEFEKLPSQRQLRRQFPPRPAQPWWPATARGEDEVLSPLASLPFLPETKRVRAGWRRGAARLLRWLSAFPGDTWQQRWEASRAEDRGCGCQPSGWGTTARQPPATAMTCRPGCLTLICGDVIRPGLAWMLTRNLKYLAPGMTQVRDPGGFARLGELAESGPAASLEDARHAAARIATLLRMLLLAASIAAGTPVSLCDALVGIDRRNASLVVAAITHATGQQAGAPGRSG